jgi:thymidine kinase
MFANKTTTLIHIYEKCLKMEKQVLIINHSNDTRTDNFIETHNNNKKEALKTNNLMNLITDNIIDDYDVIIIDEAQFFNDLKKFILFIETTDKIVYIAGLDGDSERKPFGQILDCIPLCDTVTKLRALDMIECDGNTKAPFTKRYVKTTNSQIQVGASDCYKAVSRENYLKDREDDL